MEELRRLEQVQRTLEFMESRGIAISSDRDSKRFLANLILLLIQPHGELEPEKKCSLVADHMPTISAAFLEEASLWLSREGITEVHDKLSGDCLCENFVDKTLELDCDDKMNVGSLKTNSEHMDMVGLDAMQRANSTLEDFCRSYFMFHGMDVNRPQSLFKYLPVLSFTESFIYQLDILNEKILHVPASGITFPEKGSKEGNKRLITKFTDVFKRNPFMPLESLLECHGLLTDRIREELRCGEEYWALERKLCCALMRKEETPVEDVIRAIHLKSFDYRVLNLLLYQLRGEKLS